MSYIIFTTIPIAIKNKDPKNIIGNTPINTIINSTASVYSIAFNLVVILNCFRWVKILAYFADL